MLSRRSGVHNRIHITSSAFWSGKSNHVLRIGALENCLTFLQTIEEKEVLSSFKN